MSMSECPHCRRRLLSQASPTCNWCGREIEDTAYQQRAAVTRDAFFVEQALHDAASLAAMEGFGMGNPLGMGTPWLSPLDPLTGLPLRRLPPSVSSVLPPTPPEPPVQTLAQDEDAPDTAPGARFRHLEL